MKSSSVDYAIIDLLGREPHHLKAHEVYEMLHQRFPALNPSTVYRALDRLAQSGVISVSDLGTGASVYELVKDGMHHHLVCKECEQVITIEHGLVNSFFDRIETAFHFRVATNHLVLFGVCSRCQAADDDSS